MSHARSLSPPLPHRQVRAWRRDLHKYDEGKEGVAQALQRSQGRKRERDEEEGGGRMSGGSGRDKVSAGVANGGDIASKLHLPSPFCISVAQYVFYVSGI